MTLESGDRLFFSSMPAQMTLQFISLENLEPAAVTKVTAETDMPKNGSTVFLRPRDVAVLLNALQYPKHVEFERQEPTGGLKVRPNLGSHAGLVLEAGDNTVALTAMECNLLRVAIESSAWRLFQ